MGFCLESNRSSNSSFHHELLYGMTSGTHYQTNDTDAQMITVLTVSNSKMIKSKKGRVILN